MVLLYIYSTFMVLLYIYSASTNSSSNSAAISWWYLFKIGFLCNKLLN